MKISKDGILHTKSECDILEHDMNTQNCNPKRNNMNITSFWTFIIRNFVSVEIDHKHKTRHHCSSETLNQDDQCVAFQRLELMIYGKVKEITMFLYT